MLLLHSLQHAWRESGLAADPFHELAVAGVGIPPAEHEVFVCRLCEIRERCSSVSVTLGQRDDQPIAEDMVDTFVRVTGRRARYASAYAREDLLHYFPAFGANEHLVRELVGMVEYAVEYGISPPRIKPSDGSVCEIR